MKWFLVIFAIGLIVFVFCACTVAKESDEQSLNDFQRFKMCLKCPLDPDECGRTNKIMRDGNCTKVEENG